ncbi:related to high-affinity phosphate permease, phosphate-repressible [Rhynchosporium graminicola]|uniref:Related to high-affinity phosphate permease, phosphate-repressible n=1 Tax=Rhynchosporium graminicola TaxID=2792576 RepID=A0A1E1L2X5_9HELO|nr:related to high-affinity phosphate permease, phosphate-repressible [Rhynchosporium commune]
MICNLGATKRRRKRECEQTRTREGVLARKAAAVEMEYLPEPAIPVNSQKTIGGNAAFHNFHNDYSHVQDPNLRRRLALSEIDKVPFGWYHIRAVTVAGIGFFTDSYDIFAINLVTSTLGMVFWQGPPIAGSNHGGNYGILPMQVNTAIKAATSGGAVVGQLGFGWLADKVGRRKMYGVELAIIITATLAQSLAAPSQAVTMTGLLIFWRVVMGIGIGGDYPLSAVITSEFAPTRWRGGMMAAVFSMQGAGQFAAALVALITTVCFKGSFINTSDFSSCHEACQLAGDRSWRIIIGFGGLPAIFALYYRITIPETPRYTFDIKHDIEKAQADIKAYMNNQKEGEVDLMTQEMTKKRIGHKLTAPRASWSDVWGYFSQWKNFKVIFGTTTAWFFLDLAFYGLSLNNSIVLNVIGYTHGSTIYQTLLNTAIGNLILVCAGSLPGYWLSVATIDTLGRKTIQIMGFFFLTIIFIVIGFAYNALSEGSLLALYILAQFFFNFGPNTTTFIIPGECFPTRYRSTGHGLSAAMGKIGAIIAQVIAQPLLSKGAAKDCVGKECAPWINHLMQIFALFMFCGLLVSFLVPETKGRTLEELSGEEAVPLDPHSGGRGDGGPASLEKASTRWWIRFNPFDGGKPAGFRYPKSPNLGPRSPGILGKRQRVGIMTSPELLPRTLSREERKRPKHEREGSGYERHSRVKSDTSANGSTNRYSVGVESYGRHHVHNDGFVSGGGGGAPPGWGAGWGVQMPTHRGDGTPERSDGRIESIKLLDVGKLLK